MTIFCCRDGQLETKDKQKKSTKKERERKSIIAISKVWCEPYIKRHKRGDKLMNHSQPNVQNLETSTGEKDPLLWFR